jgi:hypothetical protein
MTTKHPSAGLAAPGAPDPSEETIDDSLDEILLEANEKSLENPIRPAQPMQRLQLPQPGSAGPIAAAAPLGPIVGAAPAPLPLPGIAPLPVEEDAVEPTPTNEPPPVEEITQNARPSVLDERGEEETKVEPAETARHAAASRGTDEQLDQVDNVGLTDQASAEREKALRRLTPPAPPMPARPSDRELSEFEDPEEPSYPTDSSDLRDPTSSDGYDPLSAADTPGAIAIEDDDDESTANGRGPMSGTRPDPVPFGARLPPPGALGGHTRLPTPVPGAMYGSPGSSPIQIGLPTPNQTFAPVAVSPFGNVRASAPAIPIPAPRGAPATGGRSIVYRRVTLPVGGVLAIALGLGIIGFVIGALITRGGSEPTTIVAAPAPAPAPTQPRAAAPAAPVAAAAPAPASAPPQPAAAQPATPTPTAAIKEPTTAIKEPPPPPPEPEEQAAAPEPTPAPLPKAVTPRPIRKLATTQASAVRPKPKKKETDSRGVSKGWVDPFSQ